jgi:hypothetical protein
LCRSSCFDFDQTDHCSSSYQFITFARYVFTAWLQFRTKDTWNAQRLHNPDNSTIMSDRR